ncbi:MAG: hypothetical protein HZB14_05645 [Actinobacteria bacterium]|nr:hypothetical protein [Actinomycetota bacterium]
MEAGEQTGRPAPASAGDWLKVRVAALRVDSRAWIKLHALELWVITGLWMLISLAIFWLATGHESPRRFQDEFLFWSVAESFAGGDGLTWRGEGIGLYYFLYPVMLAPAFWLGGSVAASYTLVHLLDSLFITGVIFPAFLLARMYMRFAPAVLAAIFAVAAPAMNYAGIIGTESLAYPAATAALAAIVLSIARPRRRNWALALVMIGVALFTRAQFAVFAPVYLAALVLAGLMLAKPDRREYFRVQREPIGLLVATHLLAIIALVVIGRGVVGLYQGIFEGVSPDWSDIVYWAKALLADVYMLGAVIPVIATVAMWFHRENRRDPLVGALLAVSLIATLALVAQITWFSSINPYDWRSRHIFYERYMFYLGPLYFTGLLVAWKRVSLPAALASSAIAVVIMTGFQTDSVLIPFSYDSFSLTLVGWYLDAHQEAIANIGMRLAGVTAILGALYTISRLERSTIARILGGLAVAVSLAILVGGQAQTWYYARLFSGDAFAGVAKPANFVDRNTDQDVGMIVTSTDSPEMYFTAEFWNDRIVRAFETDDVPFQTPVMYSPRCTFDFDETGAILGTGCDKVPSAYYLRNDTVSMHLKDEVKRVHPSDDTPNISLMVGTPPPRILSIVDGRNVISGEMNGTMNVRTFLDRPGKLRVEFAEVRSTMYVRMGPRGKGTVQPGKPGSVTVDLPANEALTPVSIRTPGGVPGVATVTDVKVKQGDGGWISIR